MSDRSLLKSIFVRNGWDSPASGVAEITDVTYNTAYAKLRGDNAGFTEKALRQIYQKTDMTLEEFEKIFLK